MKTRKILALLLISLLVFTVTPMSAFAADEVTSVTLSDTEKIKSEVSGGLTYHSRFDVNNVLRNGGRQIYEAELVIPETGSAGSYLGNDSGSVFYPIWWNGNQLLIGSEGTGKGSTLVYGNATKGETYYVICDMNVLDTPPGTMDVYINGEKVADDTKCLLSTVDSRSNNAGWRKFYITDDVEYAKVYVAPADFDAAKYAASASVKSSIENVEISGNSLIDSNKDYGIDTAIYGNMSIALGNRNEKVTKKALLDSLDISAGAAAVLYGADGTEVLGDTDYVENGAVLKITSENEKISNDYAISVTYKWPAVPFTKVVDNTAGTSTSWNRLSGIDIPTKGDVVVIEYDYTVPVGKTSEFYPVTLSTDGDSKYWRPVVFQPTVNEEEAKRLMGNIRNGVLTGGADRIHIGYYNEGEKLHVVSVLRLDDNDTTLAGTKTKARLFINGVEVITEGPVGVNYSDNYVLFGVLPGQKAALTMYRGMDSVADFDYDDYMANVSVKDDAKGVYVTGGSYNKVVFRNQGITVANSEITTVEGLISALNVEGTASVYATASAETAMLNTAALATGNVLKVTSANEKVSNSYIITVADEDAITFTEDTKGNIIASVIPSDLSNTLFLAGYSEAGELKALEIVRNGAMADSTFVKSDTLQAGLTASEASGCQVIRAFYWTSEMNPIDAEVYVNN